MTNAPFWKILGLSFLFMSLISYWFITSVIGTKEPLFTQFIIIKISCVMGGIMGLMYSLINHMSNQSKKFWDYAEVFDYKIHNTKALDDLEKLYTNEFEYLKTLASGSPHYQELKRLYSMLAIKIETLKK